LSGTEYFRNLISAAFSSTIFQQIMQRDIIIPQKMPHLIY